MRPSTSGDSSSRRLRLDSLAEIALWSVSLRGSEAALERTGKTRVATADFGRIATSDPETSTHKLWRVGGYGARDQRALYEVVRASRGVADTRNVRPWMDRQNLDEISRSRNVIRDRNPQQEALLCAVTALASSAARELRSKLATAAGSIPSVVASDIEFSSGNVFTASSLVFGSAVRHEHIVTATITVYGNIGGLAARTLGATAVSGEVREFGGAAEGFEVPVECSPDAATFRIRDHVFEDALRDAQVRLFERGRPE